MIETLLRDLRSAADFHRLRAEDGAYNLAYSLETFVLEHGRPFIGRDLPKGLKRGRPRICYFNSADAALQHGLTYVEGYALNEGLRPFPHAWCFDGTGAAFELTLKTPCAAYFGIPVRASYLSQHFKRCCRDRCYKPIFDVQSLPTRAEENEAWQFEREV
jgi:hypothetical protein